MTNLSARIEAAQPGEEADLVRELATALLGEVPDRVNRCLAAQAYLSAAEMLMPVGEHRWSLDRHCSGDPRSSEYQARISIALAVDDPEELSGQWIGDAATPALALAAAIARSLEQ